jgi:hypothetical protein
LGWIAVSVGSKNKKRKKKKKEKGKRRKERVSSTVGEQAQVCFCQEIIKFD